MEGLHTGGCQAHGGDQRKRPSETKAPRHHEPGHPLLRQSHPLTNSEKFLEKFSGQIPYQSGARRSSQTTPGGPVALDPTKRSDHQGFMPGQYCLTHPHNLKVAGSNPDASSPDVYASRRGCRTPCKTRFRPAGCAFAERDSNPIGHSVGRFQTIPSSFPRLHLALGQCSTLINSCVVFKHRHDPVKERIKP